MSHHERERNDLLVKGGEKIIAELADLKNFVASLIPTNEEALALATIGNTIATAATSLRATLKPGEPSDGASAMAFTTLSFINRLLALKITGVP